MRYVLAVLLGVLCSVGPAAAQVSIGIGLPSVSIGINLPVFPELVVVPNYPVYYAPRGDVNLFFYEACTGRTRAMSGTRAPGTTDPGDWWARNTCRLSSCAYLSDTIASRRWPG